MKRAGLVSLSLLFAATAPAIAEDTDITGAWNFTANLNNGCSFHGQATLTPVTDTSKTDYGCELTTYQSCKDGYEAIVRQTCRVRNTRGQIWLRSTIVEYLNDVDQNSYVPDHFSLSVQSSSEMIGALTTSIGASPAVWTRNEGSTS